MGRGLRVHSAGRASQKAHRIQVTIPVVARLHFLDNALTCKQHGKSLCEWSCRASLRTNALDASAMAHKALHSRCRPQKKAPHRGGAFYFVQTGYRESSDSPRLKAFCRVAPSVRFKVRAMLAARVFLRAIVFNVRTSDDVHDRRFDFLGI